MKTCPTCQGSYPNNYQVCPADGSPLQEIGTWSDGSVIRGKYRLLAKVGQGGMGSVYKALHLAFDELRALKVIAPELLTDELFVKRFKHEAVITRRLQHPNAVRVDDIDEAEDGRPYIVMEFIDGKSLKKLIREEGALPVPRVLSIVKQTASALEAAHKLGMVHRDIKPDNIALVDTPDGEMVKVLDFGIAKVKEARMGEAAGLTLTGAGVVIGTPQYMSPEQAMGKRGDELDGRADLYSLGVVMYQMLTADLPFKADTTMEMLLCHMQKPPAPIEVLHPELQVPENVAALTMRLLEKDRDMRPATARVLIQEIERVEKELASPPPPPPPLPVLDSTRLVPMEDQDTIRDDQGMGGRVIPPPRPQPPPIKPEPLKPPFQGPIIKPTPKPPPIQPQPGPRPKPPESRWGMYVAISILLVGIAGGGLYYATHHSAPTGYLTANPVTVNKGDAATLSWSIENATDVDIEPGVGRKQAQGSTSVSPQDSTTYSLTATGPGGSLTTTAHVDVNVPVTPPQPEKVRAHLSVNSTRVQRGQSVTLTWTSQNATDLDLEPGVGKVDANGNRSLTPEESTTYTLTATGPGGQVSPSVHVAITAPSPPPPPATPCKKVKGRITMGDFLFGRGEYDDAIAQYSEGARMDPTCSEIRQKLAGAIKACTTERKALNENYKCGGN